VGGPDVRLPWVLDWMRRSDGQTRLLEVRSDNQSKPLLSKVINPTRGQAAAIVLILVLGNRKNPVAKSPVFDRGFAGFIAFFRLERDADCYRIVGFASALGRCCKMTS
jgi:hypothetical protein